MGEADLLFRPFKNIGPEFCLVRAFKLAQVKEWAAPGEKDNLCERRGETNRTDRLVDGQKSRQADKDKLMDRYNTDRRMDRQTYGPI